MSITTFDPCGPLPSGITVLEASAGTGKTHALATLAVRTLAETDIDISQMMMVTFTRAAAQELKERVHQRLVQAREALSGEPTTDPVLTKLIHGDDVCRATRLRRIIHAITHIESAMISTTHEFCHAMLTELGVLADPEPDPTLVEDFSELAVQVASDLYIVRYSGSASRPFTYAQARELGKTIAKNPGVQIGPDDDGGNPAVAARLDFARALIAELSVRKDRLGLYSFDDMQSRLWEALDPGENDPVRAARSDIACARLAQRFRVVMIDEFQDTDPMQWRIVERAFGKNTTLTLIGDPKQAIYGFRGGDVASYVAAVRSIMSGEIAGSIQTLGTNWRTDHRTVSAIGHLLRGIAFGDENIAVRPVGAVNGTRLNAPGPWAEPVRIKTLDTNGDNLRVQQVRDVICDDLVNDLVRLLSSGATVDRQGVASPVAPGHIAILVSSHRYGRALQSALVQAHIPVSYTGGSSVFASDAAAEWLLVLRALAEPVAHTIRRASLSHLIGWDLSRLLADDSDKFTILADQFRGWNQTLQSDGVPALTEEIITSCNAESRLLSYADGVRHLTDLRHVAQLLHAAKPALAGAAGLADWLDDAITSSNAIERDGRVPRLDLDADAVTIQTIHAAKGLQYPIVYLPEACMRWVSSRDEGKPFVYHDPDRGRILDVGGTRTGDRIQRWGHHLADEGDEDLRKLYVGLTRAECQVTTWWVPSKASLNVSSLQRVLFRSIETTPTTPDRSYPHRDLSTSEVLPGHGIALLRFEPEAVTPYVPQAPTYPNLAAATFPRILDSTWRRTSYSGLTAEIHGMANASSATADFDEPDLTEFAAMPHQTEPHPLARMLSPMADLAGGTAFGSLVHAILEQIDPAGGDPLAALKETSHTMLKRFPVRDLQASELADALLPSLMTPLGSLAPQLTLADIPRSDRLAELDFEMPWGGLKPLILADVADLLDTYGIGHPHMGEYADRLRSPELGSQLLRGFLTGSIDAVLRLPGDYPRHLVVDYKTNRIGPPGAPLLVGHYDQQRMAAAMMDSHYPLQALLYSVALHRFLRWRLSGYDPALHLGGVAYLFLRGMAGSGSMIESGIDAGEAFGVFAWRPSAALIVALSDALGGAR